MLYYKIYIVYRDLITMLIISVLHFTIIPISTDVLTQLAQQGGLQVFVGLQDRLCPPQVLPLMKILGTLIGHSSMKALDSHSLRHLYWYIATSCEQRALPYVSGHHSSLCTYCDTGVLYRHVYSLHCLPLTFVYSCIFLCLFYSCSLLCLKVSLMLLLTCQSLSLCLNPVVVVAYHV